MNMGNIGPMRSAVCTGVVAAFAAILIILWLGPKPVVAPPGDRVNIEEATAPKSPATVTSGTKSVALNESFSIAGGYTLTPVKIVEDSRCPANVQCIWAGRLVVVVRVDSQVAEPKARDIEIQLGQGTVLGGYNITLEDYTSNKFIFKVEKI